MTLPSKTSRSIEVNGRPYRWMVRKNRGLAEPVLRLTVQSESSGELFQRDFPAYVSTDTDEEPSPNTVTPADVKAFIFERFPQP